MTQILGTNNFLCDRCGAPVGNGGVDKCIVVSDLDPDRPGMVRNLHFCREDGEPGCASILLSPGNLEWYLLNREETGGSAGTSPSGRELVDSESERAKE